MGDVALVVGLLHSEVYRDYKLTCYQLDIEVEFQALGLTSTNRWIKNGEKNKLTLLVFLFLQ